MIQMAFIYKFYSPDDDPIVSKKAAILQKNKIYYVINKSVASGCIIYYFFIPVVTVSFVNVWSASRGVLLCTI